MATEDGWEPSPRINPNDPLLVWRTVPGSDVTLQVRNDDAGTAMLAYAADYHAYVEPLVDRMTACYTPTNSVSTSNHLNATAMDFNWDYYPWKKRGNLRGDKLARLRELLDYWRGIMFWAGDWSDAYVDEMHHQMDYGSYDLERNGQLRQWIKDHIRADGFSTFRRGAASTPAAPAALSRADGYALTIIDVGRQMGITPRGIQIALATGLVESNLKVYANARVPASMSLAHDAVGSDAYSVGIFQQQVRDTGNGWWWGDAATCMDPASSARLFYQRLAKLDYNGAKSPGSYAQDVQDSAYPDRYDQRFAEAVQLYDRLTQLSAPTDPWEVMLMSAPFASASHFRLDDAANLSPVEALRQNNAMIHEAMVIDAALRGEIWAVQSLAALAGGVLPGSQDTFWKVRAAGLLNAIQALHPDWIAAATPGKAA